METSSGTSRLMVRSWRALGSQSRMLRRFSPARPLISSACASTPSSEPYFSIHLAAVFGPTLSTPGMLSIWSPISVR